MDPSHPTISELDLKRLNISQYKAQEIKDNIRFKGSAIGDRLPKREYFVGWYEDSGQPKYTWMTKPEWEVFCDENTEDDSDDDWDW